MQPDLLDTESLSRQLAELQQRFELKHQQLDAVLQLTQAINYNFSNAALFEIYGYLLSSELGIGRYLLYLDEDDWRKYGSRGLHLPSYPEKPDVLGNKQQIRPIDTGLQELFPDFEVVIPVLSKQRILAYVLLGHLPWQSEIHKDILPYIQAITNILAVSNENRKLLQKEMRQEKIQQELSLAAQMQGLLIPDKLPHDRKIEMAAVYLPHRDVGGDYYDVVKLPSEELVFCVADVSGKGIPAALLMSNFQANLRALIEFHPNLRELVARLNKAVLNITKGDKFITMFIGKLDEKTGLLKYISAGHVPPLLLRGEEITELREGTTILGMFDELPFLSVGKIQLRAGDMITAFTDGVSEVNDYRGRVFDMANWLLSDAKHVHEPIKSLHKELVKALIRHKGDRNFDDDLSLLSLRFRG
ncbi:MAG: PP2C family protein-serine/threonine phosphatase [Bacteroidia bacterium]